MGKGKPWSPRKAAIIAFIGAFLLIAVVAAVIMTAKDRHSSRDSFTEGETFGRAAGPAILVVAGGAAALAYFGVKRRRDRGE